MKNDQDFEKAIASFPDKIREIARQTRSLVYAVLPEVVEVVLVRQKNTGFGTGIKKKTEHFCWIMPASKHVNLGFNYGTELPDPYKLLEGTGKLFRHIKIKSVDDLKNPALLELLKYATTHRVPPIKQDQRPS